MIESCKSLWVVGLVRSIGLPCLDKPQLWGFSRVASPWLPKCSNGKSRKVYMGKKRIPGNRAGFTWAKKGFLGFTGYDTPAPSRESSPEKALNWRERLAVNELMDRSEVTGTTLPWHTTLGAYKKLIQVPPPVAMLEARRIFFVAAWVLYVSRRFQQLMGGF